MKKLLGIFCSVLGLYATAFAQDLPSLGYYLPDSVNYNKQVPVPKAILGHEVGEWHVTHDKLVQYMKALAAARPDRVKLQVTGHTYEGREQLLLFFSSNQNLANLESIRQEHVALCNPGSSAAANLSNMPLVVWMGYSIHGNESSGSNAALLAAYYLTAMEGPQADALLSKTVVLLDPSFNPDGLNRFATWANQHKSFTPVTDPQSREFNEVWPGGRFNHYWFDLNRDWLPAVHVESQNRLRYFHAWRPNILTDHHEMGSNATFFFQPGVPSRVNPLTPPKNQELTAKIGTYHARFLDRIGSLYYTKEGFDDYYYGKGSTFPDIHGSVGILFEQASSRGHAQMTDNGLLTFPFTIRNQFTTTLSTLEAAKNLREELLAFQRDSYQSAVKEAAAAPAGAWVFGDARDPERTRLFAEMLLRHQVQMFPLKKNLTIANATYSPGMAYAIPLRQPQYRLIKAVFDTYTTFKDSLFYDITAWTMPMAYGLDYAAIRADEAGIDWQSTITEAQLKPLTGKISGDANPYAYLVDWAQFQAPGMLHQLLEQGILVKVATRPFMLPVGGQSQTFAAGTLVIPANQPSLDRQTLLKQVEQICQPRGIQVTGVATGNVLSGSDLGSNLVRPITKKRVALLTGNGVSPTDAGEVWHLFDRRMGIPITSLPTENLSRADLSKYQVIVMVGGSYGGIDKEKVKQWVESGGVLVAFEDAVNWCAGAGLGSLEFNKPESTSGMDKAPWRDMDELAGARRMNGAVVRANLDTTHPIGFGYHRPFVDLLKTNSVFMKPGKAFSSPLVYGANPLQSGYVQVNNLNALKNTASAQVQSLGRGKVILMADNPIFRGFWLGGFRLFMNAVYFGPLMSTQ